MKNDAYLVWPTFLSSQKAVFFWVKPPYLRVQSILSVCFKYIRSNFVSFGHCLETLAQREEFT